MNYGPHRPNSYDTQPRQLPIEQNYLYIMARMDGRKFAAPCKVGITANMKNRLTSVRTSSPFKIGLYWYFTYPSRELAVAAEKLFHESQASLRAHGEWFSIEPEQAYRAIYVQLTIDIWLDVGNQGEAIVEMMRDWSVGEKEERRWHA